MTKKKHKKCSKCKYASSRRLGYSLCSSPKIKYTKRCEDGSKIAVYKFCYQQREDGYLGSFIFQTCGKRGRFYEEKSTEK